MRALFANHSPKRREQAPRTSNANSSNNNNSNSSNNDSHGGSTMLRQNSQTSWSSHGSSSGGGAHARRLRAAARATTTAVRQPAASSSSSSPLPQPPTTSHRRRNLAFLRYGKEETAERNRKVDESMLHRTREHARLIAMKMSDEATTTTTSPRKSPMSLAFADFDAFAQQMPQQQQQRPPETRMADYAGDTDSAFHSQASSFFDEDPFAFGGEEPARPVRKQQTNHPDEDVFATDWPPHLESPKSMSTMPSNSSMQSSFAQQQQQQHHQQQHQPPVQSSTSSTSTTTTPQKPTTQYHHAHTQPQPPPRSMIMAPETPEIRPSFSSSSSTGAAERRRMRRQMKQNPDLIATTTPPQSPQLPQQYSIRRYGSNDSSTGSTPPPPQPTHKNRLGDHVQHYNNHSNNQHQHRHREGSWSNRSVSQKSVASSTSGSDIFDSRTGVGGGFTFDAFGLDASQINAQVNEAMQDLAGTHPDLSFFLQTNDDDFANGRWNQQESPAPSRASTPTIAEEGDGFVDGFRVTKQAALPAHIRQPYSPSSTERSSLTSESNHHHHHPEDDGAGRINLFKEKAAFSSSVRPRMMVRPPGPHPDPHSDDGADQNNDDDDDNNNIIRMGGLNRRGRRVPDVPDLAVVPHGPQQPPMVEFVGEDSEASFPVSGHENFPQHQPRSDVGVASSDGGVASDVGVQSGPDSDVAIESSYHRRHHPLGRNNYIPAAHFERGFPMEVTSKKKSSTDTATTAETGETDHHHMLSYEEKKEEEKPGLVRNAAMTQWQPRDKSARAQQDRDDNDRYNMSPPKEAAATATPPLTRQSLEHHRSHLDHHTNPQQHRTQDWPSSHSPIPDQPQQQSLHNRNHGSSNPALSPQKPLSPSRQKLVPFQRGQAPKSESGAALRSSHVNSVMERLKAHEAKMSDSKSDAGPSPYKIQLRKTGLLSRPSEDDAERPLTPLAQRKSPRFSANALSSSSYKPQQSQMQSAPPRLSIDPYAEPIGPAEMNSRALVVPVETAAVPEKKLTYRERREMELLQQREEQEGQQQQQHDQQEASEASPEKKDVASLIRKRIAANKRAAISPPDSANKNEAQDKLSSLRPTYSRSTTLSSDYSHSSSTNHGSSPQPAQEQSRLMSSHHNHQNKQQQQQQQSQPQYQNSSKSINPNLSRESKDLSIETADSNTDGHYEAMKPSAAVSHLLMLQQLQSKNETSHDISPSARHQMLISVGSGDAEDHKKSTTPKATKMMLNAFLAGRSSIGEGGEAASAAPSEGKANSATGGGASGLPALKDDPKYEKYFKMLKLGMPVEVVKHAMTRDGEDPSVMDQDPNKPAGVPLKDDPTYQKYFKMLKIGMPMDAVKHAMIRDGLDCSVMDQDHNLPVSKMTKKDDDEEPKERDSRRRARLHWKTLRKVTSNSLWAKIDQEVDMGQIEIDEEEFQELFQAEHDEIKTNKTLTSTPAKGSTVRVIDTKRANNGGIILARLKMSHDDMADAVDRINEHALTAEQIENIIEYLPSKEERKALETYMLEGGQDAAEKFEGLCECEKFMVSMMTVKHAKRKVRALLFKLQFERCLDDILKDTLAIEAACDNLTHSVRLRQLLGIILDFGNRLNTAGNKRRRAGAFTLDSLLKLNQAKAFDRKTTFLNYIILIVQRNNEILLNFKDDLPAVFKADKVFWDQCLSDLEEVESQLENVRKIALYQARQAHYRFRRRRKQDGDDDESLSEGDMDLSLEEEVEALRSTPVGMFTLSAIKYVSSLRDKVEETKAKFAHLLEYFGEEDKGLQPHELFSIMVRFCRDFEKAKEELFALEKKKQREERKRQAGRPPTHSPAPPSTEKKRQPMLRASSHQPNLSAVMKAGQDKRPPFRQQTNPLPLQNTLENPPHLEQPTQQSRNSYERSHTIPQEHEQYSYSYNRAAPMPSHSSRVHQSQEYRNNGQNGVVFAPGDVYISSPSKSGAISAAARLKAKARIHRNSPTPMDQPNSDARANHYEAQARATAEAQAAAQAQIPAQEYSSNRNYLPEVHSIPPQPPSSYYEPSSVDNPPSRSPRSSFRHKRRMEARERIRQAASRG